ncbi:MAG TPA: secondary thiamine-phosphate synthase enzyme YjbQ [Dehalococcoidia bacterium]|nr:secondary thiamine-phosphate synthase enzyme YjbQ [Dehalococcoidia bacterium]
MPVRAQLRVRSRQQQCLEDITDQVREAVRRSGVRTGLCHLYVPHTTAGIVVNENADPDVARDIIERLEALVPRDGAYRHYEGNAHAHIKASLVGQWALLPVAAGDLALGRWQGIFLAEFDGPRERTVLVTLLPAAAGESVEVGP